MIIIKLFSKLIAILVQKYMKFKKIIIKTWYNKNKKQREEDMRNLENIRAYFQAGETSEQRLGIEMEHFICDADGYPIPYEKMKEIFLLFEGQAGIRLYYEDGCPLGIFFDEYTVSLEPAAQLEVSIAPQEKMSEIERIYDEFRTQWEPIITDKGYQFVQCGVLPLTEKKQLEPATLEMIPKKRYQYMSDYFNKIGKYGAYMMRATASTQISIDYENEKDAIHKYQLLQKMAPFIGLFMENSEVGGEKHLHRAYIWERVDPARTAYFPGSMDENYGYTDYAKHVYECPLIFEPDQGEHRYLGDVSAKDLEREMDTEQIEHMLSMVFPSVRLKQYLEVRVADSVDKERMLGYAAFMKGLFYNQTTLQQLEKALPSFTTVEEIFRAEHALQTSGYKAQIEGRSAASWILGLLDLARAGLSDEEGGYLQSLYSLLLLEEEYRNLAQPADEAHCESARLAKDYLAESTAKYHNRVVRTLYVPKIYTAREEKIFEDLVQQLYGIFQKIIAEYETNPQFRERFGFDSRLEELILRPRTYSCDVPIARIDIFYDEDSGNYHFCEFNTDGTSAMNEDRELNIALGKTKAYQEFSKRHKVRTKELFDSWVVEFEAIYKEFAKNTGSRAPMQVAIVDFMENATENEFHIFAEHFRAHGAKAQVCEIRDLKWDGSMLRTPDGMEVTAIYRRAVTTDIMAHFDEIPDFLAAVRANAVCLVGEFRTQIVHNKLLYKILHQKETQQLLTSKEQEFVKEHVPFTMSLDKQSLSERSEVWESLLQDKNRWIIKPEDSYGSYGVHAGVESDSEQWRKFVDDCMGKGYILQEFCHPYLLSNADYAVENPKQVEWVQTSNLTGLFVYRHQLKGLYSRTSFSEMISTQYNEMTLPTIIV